MRWSEAARWRYEHKNILDPSYVATGIAPALMELFGGGNWWWPGSKQYPVSNRRVPQGCSDTKGVRT